MPHKLSVAIPVFNELRSIHALLSRVAAVRLFPDWEKEILVCNDGSTDGTDAAVRRFQWTHPELEFHYLSWPTNRGKGASLQAALGVATGEILVVQDADLEYDPGSYNLMLTAILKHKADVVYGSRFLGRSFINPWHRRTNQWLTRYSNFWTGLALTDVHTCLKMFRTDLLRSLDLQERGFGFCPEVTAKLARVPGLHLIEVPVSYRPRRAAEGKKIGIRDGLRRFGVQRNTRISDAARTCIRDCLLRTHPHTRRMQSPASTNSLRTPTSFMISRRRFLQSAAASLAVSALGADALDILNQKPKRVGLIGTGWYGKSDLFRLIQVAPVEVVSLCDVDQHQLSEAAALVSQRQKSKKTPRTYADYRKMLAEKDLDIVLIGTPDHWHALQMIAAVEAGADVYVQKPISVDVLEGEAMLAAARRHNRVVQVGTQRKSTPHLVEAKKNIVDAGKLGKVAHVELCCYYHMRANGNPPLSPVPDFLDYEMWTGPAPLRPYDQIPHVRWWRTFKEYGNGIVGDMCIHMFDTARWMLGVGWPKRVYSTGGIFVDKGGKSNISDTQTATFDYDDLTMVWQHRTWGTPPDPKYPWALTLFGDKGTLKASVTSYDFIPEGKGEPIHRDCIYEREQFPEDVTEKDIELHAAPATRRHMLDFLAAVEKRSRPVADIEQGHISTAACLLANVSMELGRPLVYDPQQRQVVNDPEATRRLRRPYRQPWQHPTV